MTKIAAKEAPTREVGLAVERHFTRPGIHPFDEVEWEIRDAVIGDPENPAFEQREVEFPKSWSQNATNIVTQKYFRGKPGSPDREGSVKQMISRVTGTIATWGRDGGYFATDEDADAFEAELTHILLHQNAAFNSPVWFNVGWREDGDQQCSACFILSVQDTMESILDWNTQEGIIFKGGSGSGINLSKIRGSMEPLAKGGIASGPVSFMRGADSWAGAIKSGGGTRRAAKMVVLDVDHPDIEDFIWCKAREEEKAAALKAAGFDMRLDSEAFASVQYQNANNSVRVSDEFMKAVEEDGDWELTARVDGRTIKTVKARELMRQIADAAWRCADPGVQYDTTINRWHTCPESGRINASNPCCFVGETLVSTDEGLLKITELYRRFSEGDSLPSADCFDPGTGEPKQSPINRVWIAGQASSLSVVRTVGGHELRCTPEHRFLTEAGTWIEARELRSGDSLQAIGLVDVDSGALVERIAVATTDAVAEIEIIDADVQVFDLEVEGAHNFVVSHSDAAPGIVVHNSEYMHVDDSACNLASLNLMKFRREDGTFDTEGFEHAVDVVFLAQEIIVGPSSYPTDKIGRNARAFRQIGLGYANLGAYLMADGMPYDSHEGRNVAAAITGLMTGRAYRKSAEIAAAIGAYDEYAKNREAHNRVMQMHRDAAYEIDPAGLKGDLLEAARETWDEAVALGEKHGYRNAQATVLAPTGTISFLMDCDTTGIEPDFSLVKFKELVGGGQMTIVNRTVPMALRTLGYSESQIEQIEAHVNQKGTIIGAPELNDEHLPVFDVAVGERAISHTGHTEMMSAVQPFISGALSKTVNLPESATVEDIADAYTQGWKLGLKALAIYRDGSKTAQALRTDAGEKKDTPTETAPQPGPGPNVQQPVRRRMPRERESITHKFSIAGHEGYVTAGKYEDGSVGEIFLTDIGKEGSTLRGMMNAFATAISIGLQYGVPLEVFVRKFSYMRFDPEGITNNPEIPFAKSMPDYLMRWLGSRFIDDPDVLEDLGILTAEIRARREAQQSLLLDDAPAREGNGAGEGNGSNGSHESTDHSSDSLPAASALTDTPPVVPAQMQGRELGPACEQCGGMMQRTGSCYTCSSCGNNTGCG
ncbi:MAG: hypothetical protein AABM42_05855 [Actinomycetota bacterium]